MRTKELFSSEGAAGAETQVPAEAVHPDEAIDVGTPNFGMSGTETDGGLEVEPRKRIHSQSSFSADVEPRPRVQARADLSAGVEAGGSGGAEVDRDHLACADGQTGRSTEHAFGTDRAVRVVLADTVEEVAHPDHAAQVEPEVFARQCLELAVHDAVRRRDVGGGRETHEEEADAEVEAEVPAVAGGDRCRVAVAAADVRQVSLLTHRHPLLDRVAAVGCPTGVLASTECVELVVELGHARGEVDDLRGVDEHRVETGAQRIPRSRPTAHAAFAARVLEVIEPTEDVREIDPRLALRDGRCGEVERVETVDDPDRRAAGDATGAFAIDVCERLLDAERLRRRHAHGVSVPSAAFDAVDDAASRIVDAGGAAALDDEPTRLGRRIVLVVGAGADHRRCLATRAEEAHDVGHRVEALRRKRTVEEIRLLLEEVALRQVHVHARSRDGRRLRVTDAVAVVGLGEGLQAGIDGRRRQDDAVLPACHRRDAEAERDAETDRGRNEKQVGLLHGSSFPNLAARVTPGGGRVIYQKLNRNERERGLRPVTGP